MLLYCEFCDHGQEERTPNLYFCNLCKEIRKFGKYSEKQRIKNIERALRIRDD